VYAPEVRALILAPLLAGACSLSLDASLIPSSGASGSGGTHADASFDGSSGWGATAGDSSASDGADGADASSGGSAGAAGAATGGTDSGADASGGSAGNASPGAVDCDNEICDQSSAMCCEAVPQGGSAACQDLATACQGVTILCDSTEDCVGAMCCLEDLQHVSCLDMCPDTQLGIVEFCKDDSECPPGTSCQPVGGNLASLVPASYQTCQ
jgi:hypothetical protein